MLHSFCSCRSNPNQPTPYAFQSGCPHLFIHIGEESLCPAFSASLILLPSLRARTSQKLQKPNRLSRKRKKTKPKKKEQPSDELASSMLCLLFVALFLLPFHAVVVLRHRLWWLPMNVYKRRRRNNKQQTTSTAATTSCPLEACPSNSSTLHRMLLLELQHTHDCTLTHRLSRPESKQEKGYEERDWMKVRMYKQHQGTMKPRENKKRVRSTGHTWHINTYTHDT